MPQRCAGQTRAQANSAFLLMFVIMAVATDTRAVGAAAAIAIGGTVALEALFAGPFTGPSMNPARSLAPAVVAGVFADLWLYILGPLVGGACGAGRLPLGRWLLGWGPPKP